MGATFREHNESELAFAKELLRHDPKRKYMSKEKKRLFESLAAEGDLRSETALEAAIGRVGGFTRSSANSGDDFLHGQGEVKSITIAEHVTTTTKMHDAGLKPQKSFYANIRGLEHKRGPLRIVVYNTPLKTVEYYYVPSRVWKKWVNNCGSIVVKYRKRTQDLGRITRYKTDFKGLCRSV